jgi:hypothetical protein
MNADIRKKRLQLLSKVNRLEENCDGCLTRAHFNNNKDATGLFHACMACPFGHEISKYGKVLSTLIDSRMKNTISAK